MIRRALPLVVVSAALTACQGYRVSPVSPGSVVVDNQDYTLTAVPPDIMIVQDTSGSMCEPIQPSDGSGNACAATAGGSEVGYCSFCQQGYSSSVATAADCDPATGACATKIQLTASAVAEVLTELDPSQGQLNIGLASFPAAGSDECGTGSVQVPIGDAVSTIPKIIGVYNGFSPAGGTPTDATLLVAAADPAMSANSSAQKAIVLVTDGLPNCAPSSPCTTEPWSDGKAWGCASQAEVALQGSNAAPPTECSCSFGNCPAGASSNFCCPVNFTSEESWYCLDASNTVATIASLLANQGIKTYVLGMGNANESNPTVMNEMAAAGGTGQAYLASSPAGLLAALKQIIQPPRTCTYTIDGTVVNPSLISVTFDGSLLAAGGLNGYTFVPPSTITLEGTTCAAVQNSGNVGDVQITAISH